MATIKSWIKIIFLAIADISMCECYNNRSDKSEKLLQKGMTMNYKEKYIALVNKIHEAHLYAQTDSTRAVLEEIRPELREAWDEEVRKAMIDFFKHEREEGIAVFHYGVSIERMIAWLERRREQKIAEWSEEDEKIYQSIMDDTVQENQLNGEQTNWLRDIKYRHFSQSQSRWKPSSEQMKYLRKYAEQNNYDGRILSWLYDDLKKLREEQL